MTTPPAPAVRTEESLEQVWDLYEQAMAKARTDAEQAAKFEAEAAHHRGEALRLREQAADLLRQAELADDAEQKALHHAAPLRSSEGRQKDIAADHAEDVEEKVRRSPGLEHPRVRRERAAQHQAQAMATVPDPLTDPLPAGTPANGFPVAGPAAVDANALLAPPTPHGPAS